MIKLMGTIGNSKLFPLGSHIKDKKIQHRKMPKVMSKLSMHVGR